MEPSIDKKTRTPEELRQRLSLAIQLPQDAKRFFSGQRLEELIRVFRDPALVELDMMANDPAIAEDMDFIEYCTFLPEWRSVNKKFDKAGKELYEFLKKGVPAAVRKVTDCTQSFHPGPVLELYSAVTRLIISLSVHQPGIKTPFAANLQTNLLIDTYARLTYAVIEEFRKAPRTVTYRGAVQDVTDLLSGRLGDLVNNLYQTNKHLFPWGLPGYAEQKSIYQILLNNENFFRNLAELQKIGSVSRDPKILQEQIDEKHELIFELLNENDFEDFEFTGTNFRVRFSNIRRQLGAGRKANYLFKCKIILDPSVSVVPDEPVAKKGQDMGLLVDVRPGYYDLIAYSSNSNLHISNGLSYEMLFQDQTKYLQILNAIYQIFFDKIGEIDSARMKEVVKQKSVKEMAEDTHEQITEDLAPSQPAETPEFWETELPEMSSPEESHEQPTSEVTPDQTIPEDRPEQIIPEARKSSGANISLRGRKGNRVLQVLESILGPSVRCEGTSHFIFRGRSGKTYPISIHGKKDVGEGLLKKCLEMYGISKTEFDDGY